MEILHLLILYLFILYLLILYLYLYLLIFIILYQFLSWNAKLDFERILNRSDGRQIEIKSVLLKNRGWVGLVASSGGN